MNLRQLKKQDGSFLRLRPLPVRLDNAGHHLPSVDDQWRIRIVQGAHPCIRLVNNVTGHAVELQPDNIKEYRSPDFLLLRCQIIIGPKDVSIEPVEFHSERLARVEASLAAAERKDHGVKKGMEVHAALWFEGPRSIASQIARFLETLPNVERVVEATAIGGTRYVVDFVEPAPLGSGFDLKLAVDQHFNLRHEALRLMRWPL